MFYMLVCTCGLLLAFSTGPLPGRTGDFGETNCSACHRGNAVNAAGGSLTITGVPAKYNPGQIYPITVTIAKSGQQRWGFEFSARDASSGYQAGSLIATDAANTQVKVQNNIQYIEHTAAGTTPGTAQGSWTFNWKAPDTPVDKIRFSAAGNAANGNGANTEDFIYTTSVTSDSAVAFTSANAYVQHNLVSDIPKLADFTDPNLVNPWGISFSATGPFWLSDYGTGLSTVYTSDGDIRSTVVKVAGPPASKNPAGVTGQVQNSTTGFVVNGSPATFIFATEDGTISAWNSGLGSAAALVVDNSASGAVYTGLAIGTNATGTFLYAANFASGQIDVFDNKFAAAKLTGTFTDPTLPSGFAPFNIQNLRGVLYVAYAKQDSSKRKDVAGPGNGYVNAFDATGTFLQRVISTGPLNSPWGVAIAPASFGAFGGALLVGNFGDGLINAFDASTGAVLGQLKDSGGKPIQNSGLWGLQFGNGGLGGDRDTLYFTAGISGQSHGLFGSLLAVAPGEPELRTTLDPGFYTTDLTLQGGQSAGEAAMFIQFDKSYGGYNLGGGFGPTGFNSGFGGFNIAQPTKVKFSLNSQLVSGTTGQVVMQVTDAKGSPVGSPLRLNGGGAGTITLSLDPNFYVVSVSSSGASGVFQLGMESDVPIPYGGVSGGFMGPNITAFGGFYLGTRQRVKIKSYGSDFYSPYGAGNLQITLRTANGTARTTVR